MGVQLGEPNYLVLPWADQSSMHGVYGVLADSTVGNPASATIAWDFPTYTVRIEIFCR